MKTALITGASGGIGSAIAEKMASKGYNLALGCNSQETNLQSYAESLQGRYDIKTAVMKADISKYDECVKMYKCCSDNYDFVDTLILNAGISLIKQIQDITAEEWNHLIDVNLNSCFYLTKQFVPEMIRRHTGNIILISSMWGEVGASMEAAYSASKAGMIGYAKALAKELGPSNIRINVVSPGIIDTKMNALLSEEELAAFVEDIPIPRMGEVKDIANAVSFLCSDESNYITGQVLSVNGGYIV